jgi:hypothetical protein
VQTAVRAGAGADAVTWRRIAGRAGIAAVRNDDGRKAFEQEQW